MTTLFASLLLLAPMAADEKPIPKVPVGKDTTVATGPIDADGYIDYEAALNERLRKTTTPQTNANVLLFKAFGPRPEGADLPPEFFKELGIGELPAKGDYFCALGKHLKDNLNLPQNEIQAAYNQQSWATKRPWAAQDYPHITAWLIINEKPLAVVVEATKRSNYYHPLVSRRGADGKRSPLFGVLLPSVQKCRELSVAFAARAMLRLGEGKDDDAWRDLLAAHRLAVLVASGPTLIESLVGNAIEAIICRTELGYLEHAKLTSKQLRERLKDLQGLPPLAPIADKIDLSERFMHLDALQSGRRDGFKALDGIGIIDVPKDFGPMAQQRILENIHWAEALRTSNKWFNRAVAALRIKDRAERLKQLDLMETDLKATRKDLPSIQAIFAKLAEAGAAPDQETGKAIGEMLVNLLMPAFQKVQAAGERAEQIRYNVQTAFALAAYRLDNKRYPAKLDDLAPKYLAAVPLDVFTGKPLTYRPTEKGYLFYSFGPNGKDDEGRWYDDDPRGDDPGVRMPLPELKKQ